MRVELSFPLLGLTDEYGRSLDYAALLGPARTPAELAQVELVGDRKQLVGMTCFLTFPASPDAEMSPVVRKCVAWAHCFRDPDQFLPGERPRMMLTHSDFTDPQIVDPDRICPHVAAKEYDFLYLCQRGGLREQVNSWALARRCLSVLCGELGLRGLLVGRGGADTAELAGIAGATRLVTCSELPFPQLMTAMARSRFLFVPNELDPSPRIIAEALAMDIPVLVNAQILGGWHYVNPITGSFFHGVNDVADGAQRCLRHRFSPRRWFQANHGPLRSGARLAQLLRQVDPSLARVRRVHLSTSIALSSAGEGEDASHG